MHAHPPIFITLSILVAVVCAWVALDLFERVRNPGRIGRSTWLAAAALALGGGIWSMHFIAMQGFDPGAPVSYDLGLTVLSFLLAVLGTGAAFLTYLRLDARRLGLLAGGVLMGVSVAAMHYLGMAALRTAAVVGYSLPLVAASVAVAVAASIGALAAASRAQGWGWRALASGVLGVAVVGMHYTGMAALQLTPAEAATAGDASPIGLAIGVTVVTLTILALAVVASIVDRRATLLETLDAGGVGYWEVLLPGRTLILSSRARELLGLTEDRMMTQDDFAAALKPQDRAVRESRLVAALAGQADYDAEYQLATNGRWIHLRGRLIRSRSGRPLRLAGVVTDITDRHQAFAELAESERRQRLLINELNHRVKNTLATVQSIAALTARRTADPAAFQAMFEARLQALSNAQNLLTASGWEEASLRDLLEQTFRPYAPEQVRTEGPDVALEPEQTLAMGLVLHELAVNAAKYGAFSTPDGCVKVAWGPAAEGDAVRLTWTESGGPPVAPPTRTGFGSRLIRTSLGGALGGSAAFDYRPDGLVCTLEFRAGAVGHAPPDA